MTQLSMHSPVGDLTISEDDGAIVSVDWGWGALQTETPLLLKAKRLTGKSRPRSARRPAVSAARAGPTRSPSSSRATGSSRPMVAWAATRAMAG